AALMYLAPLAPHVRSGLLEPVLDVHVYRDRRSFTRGPGGGVRWSEDFGRAVDELLAEAGWPGTTTLQSTETNVPADGGWGSDGAHAEALSALIRGLRATPRMGLVCLYSPWTEKHEGRWLIRPNSPAGNT